MDKRLAPLDTCRVTELQDASAARIVELQSEVNQALRTVDPAPPPPRRLFHYTTATGFESIVRTQELWLTNAKFAKDQRELSYAVEILSSALGASHFLLQTQHSVFHRAVTQYHSKNDWYLASFSEKGDLLSQWRAYCGAGGYSIGFASKGLSELSDGSLLFRKVSYERDQQVELVRAIWNVRAHLHDTIPARYPDVADARQKIDLHVAVQLMGRMACFKSAAFAEECEWRLVDPIHPPSGFLNRNGTLVPFLVARPETGKRLPISWVYPSPTDDASLAQHAGYLVLQRAGYPGSRKKVRSPAARLR